MRPDQRIYSGGHIDALWDSNGTLPLTCQGDIGAEQLADLLRHGPVRFVVPSVGEPLRWVSIESRFTFWKEEVKPRLVEPGGEAILENFPGESCYFATLWTGEEQIPVVLLDEFH